jgi:hypothetical protein
MADTNGVIKRRKSKHDRQYNGQKKKDEKTKNDPKKNATQQRKFDQNIESDSNSCI